jgi:hypothetical protein
MCNLMMVGSATLKKKALAVLRLPVRFSKTKSGEGGGEKGGLLLRIHDGGELVY